MSGRGTVSRQTSLADLSLILFMVTAAVVGDRARQMAVPPSAPDSAFVGQAPVAPPAPRAVTEPLAVYVASPAAPPLAQWIAGQARDPRQTLIITAPYQINGSSRGMSQARALAQATQLARTAADAGFSARIVVEPGEGPSRVVLTFDGTMPASRTD